MWAAALSPGQHCINSMAACTPEQFLKCKDFSCYSPRGLSHPGRGVRSAVCGEVMASTYVIPAAAGLATLGLVAYELYRADSPALQKLLRSVGITRVSFRLALPGTGNVAMCSQLEARPGLDSLGLRRVGTICRC